MRKVTTPKKVTKTTASKNRIETPLAQAEYSEKDLDQQIRELAYELFTARGCAHGYDVEDWLAAEQIIKGE